ncbi:hypothetical protein ACO2RV_17160 [Ancylobacter sp. VNQ12]|uniref:hypothetical protein n=1 Tax=Ancylobacter sp. VNQ12 TaxID=3400920 RepID=UPI003C10B2D7
MLLTPDKPKGDPRQLTVKQSLPARTRSYGRVKVSGAFAFIQTYAGNLYEIVIHGEGPWDAIEEWWLNDKNAAPVSGVVSTAPWTGFIRFESFLGTDSQPASSLLTGTFPAWTADHRLRGLAYSVVWLSAVAEDKFSKTYPNGSPAVRVVARTSKVYDPRTAVTAFSENAALCIRDYLTHSRGFNISSALIDDTTFSAFANVCDEAVALAAGGTEPRYRVAFTYDMVTEPREVLRQLLQSCDAELYPTPDGKVGIRGGKWTAPTVTIGPEHIRAFHYVQGNDRLAAFNRLKLTFTFRAADYQPFECDPWEDLASQAEVGVLQQDLTLTQVPSYTQARRLGKIFSHKSNPRHRLELQVDAKALDALGERTVHVTLPELEIDEDFFVEKFELQGDFSGGTLTLASLSSDAYAWTTAEEGTEPVAPTDAAITVTPPTPTGLALSISTVGGIRILGHVDPLVGTPWGTAGRYRIVGATDWINMGHDGDWSFKSDYVDGATDYEVQAAHTGYGGINSGQVGAWTASSFISTA